MNIPAQRKALRKQIAAALNDEHLVSIEVKAHELTQMLASKSAAVVVIGYIDGGADKTAAYHVRHQFVSGTGDAGMFIAKRKLADAAVEVAEAKRFEAMMNIEVDKANRERDKMRVRAVAAEQKLAAGPDEFARGRDFERERITTRIRAFFKPTKFKDQMDALADLINRDFYAP